MKHKERIHASLKTCVMLDAMICAYHGQMTFTVAGFCARYGYPENRHVRAALNAMVKSGYLATAKRLYSDGHYRKQYYANHTRPMFTE